MPCIDSMKNILLSGCILCSGLAWGQGIRGTVYDAHQQPLPYASLYIGKLETGTTTNEEGYYEIKLPPGTYEVVFQYMGYESVIRTVEVEQDFTQLNVVLPEQPIVLREVQIRSDAEDPAYTIMRKAIAKSKFHTLQVERYTARVYTKGAGRVKDAPFFFDKILEKEGVDSSTVFLTESVSEITFEQPNTLKEKIISVRTIGNDSDIAPNEYINGSFYKPELAHTISPLSPRAFAYYRFKFAGSFFDRGYEINKIQVIPRSRGDNVFSGAIYIIEDLWSIHSLNLFTYKQGFKINVQQMYAPIQETVWQPVTHQIDVTGKIYGFDLEFKYLASVSDYNIELNPDLKAEVEVVDETLEEELAQALEAEEKLADTDSITGVFADQQQITRKQLRKTLKEYEKALEKQEADPAVVANRNIEIDSTAYTKDLTYWEAIRPIPLNRMEVKSYQKLDSIVVAKEEEEDGKPRGKLGEILAGESISINEKNSINVQLPRVNFNTVEGWNLAMPLTFAHHFDEEKNLTFTPTLRYAFAREKFLGKVNISYQYGKSPGKGKISLEGGRYVSQLNEDDPIEPLTNTLFTLLDERNYMKIYQKDYVKLSFSHPLADGLTLHTELEWADRLMLENTTDHTWRDRENRTYTPNNPQNIELVDTYFAAHEAFLWNVSVEYAPFLKYYVRNEEKRVIPGSSPTFRFTYRKGLSEIFSSDVDYDLLELGVQHQIDIGIRGKLHLNLYGGTFLNNEHMFFPDFRHFMGNRVFIQTSDPMGSFRLLDYYIYSTQKSYFGGHLYYQFRKLLLTQIMEIRLLGLKENFIFNYLKTDASPHYVELGYSLDNIFRLFRLELVSSFQGFNYEDFGFRVGISTSLNAMFD